MLANGEIIGPIGGLVLIVVVMVGKLISHLLCKVAGGSIKTHDIWGRRS